MEATVTSSAATDQEVGFQDPPPMRSTNSLPPSTTSSELLPPTPTTTASPTTTPAAPETTATSAPISTTTAPTTTAASGGHADPPQTILLVGSDSRSGLEDLSDFGDFAGRRADVIILAIRSGDRVNLVSLPRDLHVESVCTGSVQRINAAYRSCGDRHRLASLVAQVEALTDLDVDHAVSIDMAGFQDVIDAMGGHEICVDHPTRDRRSGLDLEAGCNVADGETTLQWIRSRYTEQRIDGRWESVADVSDLTRNRRQRRLIADLFGRLSNRKDPAAIREILEAVAPHMTVDDDLSLGEAAHWAWDLRDADLEGEALPVRYHTTSDGASVLLPTVDVADFVADLR